MEKQAKKAILGVVAGAFVLEDLGNSGGDGNLLMTSAANQIHCVGELLAPAAVQADHLLVDQV